MRSDVDTDLVEVQLVLQQCSESCIMRFFDWGEFGIQITNDAILDEAFEDECGVRQ